MVDLDSDGNSDDLKKEIGNRLREERERLALNQTDMGDVGGVKKLSQINYEKGSSMPSADYLAKVAAVGVDVLYVITGKRLVAGNTVIMDDVMIAYQQLGEVLSRLD